MINERLVGTWWILKGNKYPYSIFRGPSCPSLFGKIPDNALTTWYVPFNEELQKALWGIDTVLFCNNGVSDPRDATKVSVKGITFPPEEYIDDNSITEIEIKPNGDYMIFDSIKI